MFALGQGEQSPAEELFPDAYRPPALLDRPGAIALLTQQPRQILEAQGDQWMTSSKDFLAKLKRRSNSGRAATKSPLA